MNSLHPERWTVKKGFLYTSPEDKSSAMALSCPHRKAGACGGCYARLWLMLKLIEGVPEAADRIVAEVLAAMNAEEAGRRLQGKAEP